MRYENNVKGQEVMFSGEPWEVKDVMKDQNRWGDEESQEDLLFVSAELREKYMKKTLPSQQEYYSSISVPYTIYYRIASVRIQSIIHFKL